MLSCYTNTVATKDYNSVANHLDAQIYHRSNLHDELHRVYKRLGGVTYWVLSWMTYLMYLILAVFTNSWNGGFHTVHKDGTELDTKELHHIRDTIWKNSVFNRWKKGDILLIDNMRISHGRQVLSGQCICACIMTWYAQLPRFQY